MNVDWKKKLTSRKLWMSVALFVSGVLTATGNGEKAETISGLIMQAAAVVAYVIGEGLADSSNIVDLHTIEYKEGEEEDDKA